LPADPASDYDPATMLRRLSRWLVAAAALAILLGAPAGLADTGAPVLFVDTDAQVPGAETGVGIYLTRLDLAPAPGRVTVTVPNGYVVAANVTGTRLGDAEIDVEALAGGGKQALKGPIVQVDPATVATDPAFANCLPGAHAAAWRLVISGSATFVIPIVADKPATGGSQLTVCLDALRTAGLRVDELDLSTRGVFTNPPTSGFYVWSALVTPFDAVGGLDARAVYELRADEPLPQTLTIKATYTTKTKQLLARGALLANGKPREGIEVHFEGGASLSAAPRELAVATTQANGAWVVRMRVAKPPKLVAASVHFYSGRCEDAPSTAPAGCANESIDGAFTNAVAVKLVKPKPKPRKH
jgi:hypothetical protein